MSLEKPHRNSGSLQISWVPSNPIGPTVEINHHSDADITISQKCPVVWIISFSSSQRGQGGATYQREREGDGLSLQQRGTFQQVKDIHRTVCSGRHMAGEIYIQGRPLSRNAVGVKVTRGVLAHGPAQVSSTSRASAVSLFPKWGTVLGFPHTQSGMN